MTVTNIRYKPPDQLTDIFRQGLVEGDKQVDDDDDDSMMMMTMIMMMIMIMLIMIMMNSQAHSQVVHCRLSTQ